MKREDVTRIFEGATKEQIDQLLDINSDDIGRALGKQKGDLTEAQQALATAKETIATLEANQGDLEKLQKQLDAYREAEAKRTEAEKAAAARAELMERMDAVLGERKFVHDRMRDIVADDFAAALRDKANRGKSDAEVFEAITRDQGYFASQNPPAPNMPKPGDVGAFAGVTDRKSFLKLGFDDQMRFKAERPNEFKQIFGT